MKMFRYSIILCCLAMCACGATNKSNPNQAVSVVRVSPSNLSAVTSPVAFDFTASSKQPITSWLVNVDGKQMFQGSGSSELKTSLSLATGNHQVSVQASNTTGTTGSADFALTVVTGSPTPTPTPGPSPSPTPTPNPSPTPTPTPGAVTVTISPTSATLQANQTRQFTATVTGSANTGVTWLVNGTPGGTATIGTVSSSGLYQAPSTASSFQATVTAQSVANPSASANATVDVSVPTSGLNFYVANGGSDSNDGSVTHPWATIGHAAASVQPGATIHVAAGNYPVVTSNVSGTATARIKFVSDVKWGAKIVISGSDTGWNNNASYVDIEGFDISGPGRLGIANNASNVRTIGNHVHNISGGSCNSSGGAAIDDTSFTGTDNDIIGNWVNDIGPLPLGSCTTIQGIYHSNLRGHIYNNIVYRVSGWGIHLWHAASNVTIANNLVFNNGGPSVGGGIIVGDGDSPGGVTDDFTNVINNIVIHNGGRGIEEFGAVGPHNVYSNNVVFQNTIDFQLISKTPVATLQVDPQLVNYQPDGSGDYHLTATSPAVNAGMSTGAPGNDHWGGSRPVGAAIDIGPHEFNSTPAGWPYE